jgi:hypothetical protein
MQLSKKQNPAKYMDAANQHDEIVPAGKIDVDVDSVLKKHNITKEEYEKRFFWHEGKIAIVK